MMTARDQLLAEIEAFIVAHDMPASTFGKLFSNDTAFVSRFRAGATVRLDTAERLRLFMKLYQAPKASRSRRGNASLAA